MVKANSGKKNLSKGILEMKFMQRTKAKIALENDEAEGRAMYSQEISEKMRKSDSNFISESSFVLCEGLKEGRLSYRGMNAEIEALMAEEQAANIAPIKQKVEVSDQDMAKFYHANKAPAAHKTMQRKFLKNKQFKNTKFNKNKKFIKPNDD